MRLRVVALAFFGAISAATGCTLVFPIDDGYNASEPQPSLDGAIPDVASDVPGDARGAACPADATLCEGFDGELSTDWRPVRDRAAVSVTREGAVSMPNSLFVTTEFGAGAIQGSLYRSVTVTTTTNLVVEADVRFEAIGGATTAQVLWLDRTDGDMSHQHGVFVTSEGLRAYGSEAQITEAGLVDLGPPHLGSASAIALGEYHHIRVTSTETVAARFRIDVSVDNGAVVSTAEYARAASWATKAITVNLGIYAIGAQSAYRVRYDNFAFAVR